MAQQTFRGTVVSDVNDKTLVVNVERSFRHPLLKKTVKSHKRYHVHDEHNSGKKGDTVIFRECPPYSRKKRWELFDKQS